MVKKFLLSAAVIGALSTSAMAYDLNKLNQFDVNGSHVGAAAGTMVDNNSSDIVNAIGFDQTQLSNALIFPAFFADGAWESTVRVINPTNHGVVAKVVLYDGNDSHEIKDFNIFLSANDVWVGKIVVQDGSAKIISTDDSTPLENGGVASKDNPFIGDLKTKVANGYIQVIEMADVIDSAHKQHEDLRNAYNIFSKIQRTGNKDTNIIWNDGVPSNQVAVAPYIQWNGTGVQNAGWDANKRAYEVNLTDNVHGFYFSVPGIVVNNGNIVNVSSGSLTGDIRLTNNDNKTDMDMMAYKIQYNVGTITAPQSLIYLEGERANLADLEIDTNIFNNNRLVYDPTSLQADINSTSMNNAYITYGDASEGMYALITNPFKRIYVQANLDQASDNQLDGIIASNHKITDNNNNPQYYRDASVDANGNINYGSFDLVAQFYNESEDAMSAGQFSPAQTPLIRISRELGYTDEPQPDDGRHKTLATYITQAAQQGWTRGFIVLSNATNDPIPGIVTQMLATTAGGAIVTNWIVPQQQ